ncbi:MBL fold metallo-hydrolase [Alphaproteobacteria bacterium]|nr:MBL fold metallo-hydrolase [Alphaproteobacteria bacterium]MDB2575082.1 MBL fold metallo-hydrolase [Alphaproteobacteria bacterium]MDB2656008.1 MBL fold metallo-hydrolase [Alphaproteobacteria bacterium]
MKTLTTLQFVNHASILVRHGGISLLSDPWYQGDAFHKGWNLIHEFSDEEISDLLDNVTHIWISHEHPDHFSVLFFKKFGDKIKECGIVILFQYCKDQRVHRFLSQSGFKTQILAEDNWTNLSKEFEVLCFKKGFYDSGLAIRTSDKTIVNLNDCQFEDDLACSDLSKITGECDILLTQFSYASWKGGMKNVAWRQLAAKEKIDIMKKQAFHLKPKVIIPFASFMYFSNKDNFYLNDAHNSPSDIIKGFEDTNFKLKILRPFETICDLEMGDDNFKSIEFWNDASQLLASKKLNEYEIVPIEQLQNTFLLYKERVFKNNARWFMALARYLSPLPAFRPVNIKLVDLDVCFKFDLFGKSLIETKSDPDISMSSASLSFLMSNTFGFDTLTVNGCFDEERKSGFSRLARSFAIENLNNLGIEFKPSIVLNFRFIIMFVSRLRMVSKKLGLAK